MLENYHVAEAFKVLLKKECNILKNIRKEEFTLIRQRIIEAVLSTDMANHARHLSMLKNRLESEDIKEGKNIDHLLSDNPSKNFEIQQVIINMIVHCADISNPCKPKKVYFKWIDLVFEEFFDQGDREKVVGLPVSMLCDREKIDINKSQIGFINFVVKPSFECLGNLLPEIIEYRINMNDNLKTIELITKFEEEGKKKENLN